MKKTLLLFSLLFSVALFGQERSSLDYCAGQNFIGGDMAFVHYDDFNGAILGVNFGRNLTDRMTIGVDTDFGIGKYDDSVKLLSASPFFRYNILIDGPVAVFLQANVTIAAGLYDSDTYGVIWPNLSGGLSYRLSDHFTAFAKMGMLSYMAFTFGSGFSEMDISDYIDTSEFPLFAGFTKHPVVGIYYTF